MVLMFDENGGVLNDKVKASDVRLLAVVGGRVDRMFRRNYAVAKHGADCGRVKRITVVVDTDGSDVVHTVGAVVSALSGGRLHDKAVFDVRGGWAGPVKAELASLVAEKPSRGGADADSGTQAKRD